MELEDDVRAPVPPVSKTETDAKPALSPTAPAMDWLTDDLFA
ncbi:hypothetical protein [Cupriavidus necator]